VFVHQIVTVPTDIIYDYQGSTSYEDLHHMAPASDNNAKTYKSIWRTLGMGNFAENITLLTELTFWKGEL
jgi:hypothetical protein